MPLWHALTVSDAVAVTTPQIFSSTLKTHLGLHLPWECTGPVLHTLGTVSRVHPLLLWLQPIRHSQALLQLPRFSSAACAALGPGWVLTTCHCDG